MFNLIIIDPWRFGTENGNGPFTVQLKKMKDDEVLIVFDFLIKINNYETKVLLGKIQNLEKDPNLSVKRPIQLAYLEGLSEINYKTFSFDKIRANFLKGEIIAKK